MTEDFPAQHSIQRSVDSFISMAMRKFVAPANSYVEAQLLTPTIFSLVVIPSTIDISNCS